MVKNAVKRIEGVSNMYGNPFSQTFLSVSLNVFGNFTPIP